MVMGTSDRSDTDRPPASVVTNAFAGVALKVAAGTGAELAAVDITQIEEEK
jgi:hypothetical protein